MLAASTRESERVQLPLGRPILCNSAMMVDTGIRGGRSLSSRCICEMHTAKTEVGSVHGTGIGIDCGKDKMVMELFKERDYGFALVSST